MELQTQLGFKIAIWIEDFEWRFLRVSEGWYFFLAILVIKSTGAYSFTFKKKKKAFRNHLNLCSVIIEHSLNSHTSLFRLAAVSFQWYLTFFQKYCVPTSWFCIFDNVLLKRVHDVMLSSTHSDCSALTSWVLCEFAEVHSYFLGF